MSAVRLGTEEGHIVALDGERIRLRTTVSAAPGARLDGRLPSGSDVRFKVLRCRRMDAQYEVEARLVDVRREQREELVALVRPSPDRV